MLSPTAPTFEKVADPSDTTDFIAVFGDLDTANGEGIASHSIALSAEATALGVTISTEPGRASEVVNDPDTDAPDAAIKFWLSVDEDERDNRAFDEGVIVGITFTITTTASTPRTFQRVFAVQIAQRAAPPMGWPGADLIVEDGTGLETADSYVELLVADLFHAERGNTAWALASKATREAALRSAADWVDSNYTFTGTPLSTAQALQWPRVIDGVSTVHPRIKKAQMMAALEALSGPLLPRQTANPVTSVEEKLEGVGSTKTTYSESVQPRYPAIDAVIADLVLGSRGSSIGFATVVRR